MAASRTCTTLTICNLSLTSARCTGFTKVHGENDFMYVIDLEWTDERIVSVKRTFTEFQKFHSELSKLFPELHKSKLNLKTSLRENVASLFTKDKRGLAEKRESMLDVYLYHLLRQPERIRRCNLVLSFFDSRDTDPKPCKSNSPSEKADSGIDLTGEMPPSDYNPNTDTHVQSLGERDYPNTYGDSKAIDEENQDGCSEDEYDGDTSETETDDDTYDEDYFLDVGFGELMLQPSVDEGHQSDIPVSPVTDGAESSMWCSNLDKFSNILRSSMTNLNTTADNQPKSYRSLNSRAKSIDDLVDNSEILNELIEEGTEDPEETSETESQQQTTEDRNISEQCESSDTEGGTSYYSKPLSKANMRHYYLSSNNLLNASE